MSFTLDRLAGLLSYPRVFWRHDIDYHPACALEMAEFEALHGVKATFYVMARSEDYNAFSPSVRNVLYGILSHGHELGIHVDLTLPRDASTPPWLLARHASADYRLLSSVYPVTRQVSFHAPPTDVYWQPVPGFDHALGPQWADRHIADSRGVWRQEPEQFLRENERAQVSLHPEWWFLPPAEADCLRAQEAAKP